MDAMYKQIMNQHPASRLHMSHVCTEHLKSPTAVSVSLLRLIGPLL